MRYSYNDVYVFALVAYEYIFCSNGKIFVSTQRNVVHFPVWKMLMNEVTNEERKF